MSFPCYVVLVNFRHEFLDLGDIIRPQPTDFMPHQPLDIAPRANKSSFDDDTFRFKLSDFPNQRMSENVVTPSRGSRESFKE